MASVPCGVSAKEFNNAFAKALELYGDIPIENSKRTRIVASVAFGKAEHLLDIGSYVNIYPVVLRLLGMEVTVLDSFPQRRLPGETEKIDYVLENVYKKIGINVIEQDVFDITLPQDKYDRISAFEVFEHLIHSPRPILKKIYDSLRPDGKFIVAVPNIACLGKRLRIMFGESPLGNYDVFFEKGNPFTGHRREMTTKEVRLMMAKAGFELEHLFTTNVTVPVTGKCSPLKWIFRAVTNNPMLPTNFRQGIYAVGRKPH